MRFFFLILSGLLLDTGLVSGQFKNDSLMAEILGSDTAAVLREVLAAPDSFRVQIMYTQINRDHRNQPHFKHYHFHVSSDLYFYPASTVKLPLALLSLEKLNGLGRMGVDKFTRMAYDSSYSGQQPFFRDSSARDGYPSVAQFIRKAFLISDNDAYNRMYEFVGQETIHRRLEQMGFSGTRIVRQFLPLSEAENRHSNQIRFLNEKGQVIYIQPAAFNKDSFPYHSVVKIGRGFLNAKDSLIAEPMDFTRHNRITLEDLQQLLQSALFPSSVPKSKRFHLTKEDYSFLLEYLSQYPAETPYPKYDTSEFFDSYVKFYFLKGGRRLPDNIRVFNKVGWAYGFMTDVSYIVDFTNKIEFMLTTTIYTNADGILNDNIYEYDSIALPFLYRVGQDFYQYDLKRQRSVKPDLSKFRVHYESRNPFDDRPSIHIVDN
jgi:hypothetical protein